MVKLTPEQLEMVTKPKNIAARVELLKAMDTVVRSLNDESVMDLWLTSGVPDGADDSDYESIAEDVATPEDEDGDTSCFEECCRCFTACIAMGAKYGYYSGGVLGDIRPTAKIKKSIATWANIQTGSLLFRWYVEKLNMSGVASVQTRNGMREKILKYIHNQFPETASDITDDDLYVWFITEDDNYDTNNDEILVVNY